MQLMLCCTFRAEREMCSTSMKKNRLFEQLWMNDLCSRL
jgi:hypothetical protein